MPERDRSLPTPGKNRATIFKRLMLGKQTPRTRNAYAPDLRAFARFGEMLYHHLSFLYLIFGMIIFSELSKLPFW